MTQRVIYLIVAVLVSGHALIAQTQQLDSLRQVLEGRRKAQPILVNKLSADVPDPKPFGSLIQAIDAEIIVNALASDAMAGRETGTPGQELAARYIAAHFDSLGLVKLGDKHDYFQVFKLEKTQWESNELRFNDVKQKNLNDFYINPAHMQQVLELASPVVHYAGYGMKNEACNDYKRSNVHGKIVMVEGDAVGEQVAQMAISKAETAKNQGAIALLYIDPNFEKQVELNRSKFSGNGWQAAQVNRFQSGIPIIYISPKSAASIFALNSKAVLKKQQASKARNSGKVVEIELAMSCKIKKNVLALTGSNVVGMLEGADEKLKHEVVFITAHYDHLGHHNGLIHSGADDNASGTSGVMCMAKAFTAAARAGVRPKRSIVFMLVSGEEKGLLGSEYYTKFPILPLENVVCNLNSDMIGRIDDAHKADSNYIYVIGADRMSTELHEINHAVNQRYTHLTLDYKFNAPNDPNHYYERSDHYNFAVHGIPCIFYFNGTHADYHKPTDTADKIDTGLIAKRAQLAFFTAWEVANKTQRIYIDKPVKKK